jgi:hypothetical protein
MTAKDPCTRCKKEIHPVRELARNCPRCMGRFHARCARDGDECAQCSRVFAPPILGPRIEDRRPFLPEGLLVRLAIGMLWGLGL